MLDYSKWHIEPTNRCTLKCSKCSRLAYDYNKLGYNDIDPDALVHFWKPIAPDIQHVNLCGNHGDPLYHPELIKLRNKIRELNPAIHISMTTNGSYRPKRWWEEFMENINPQQDSITFSVDGLEDTNHFYRQNCDWPSILQAMEIVGKTMVTSAWKFIIFNHNEHQVEEAERLAKKLGITRFRVVKSSIWHSIEDKDMPTDLDNISEEIRPIMQKQLDERLKVDPNFKLGKHNKGVTYHSPDTITKQHPHTGFGIHNLLFEVQPKCVSHGNLYISADNVFTPCCWYDTAHNRISTVLADKRKEFSIYNKTYFDIEEHLEKIGWMDTIRAKNDYVCNKMCGQSLRQTYDYNDHSVKVL